MGIAGSRETRYRRMATLHQVITWEGRGREGERERGREGEREREGGTGKESGGTASNSTKIGAIVHLRERRQEKPAVSVCTCAGRGCVFSVSSGVRMMWQ